ncbi:MAG: M20/M25/M40 family metallo-hydrolase, partial [Armatimonadota bacterium]
MTQGIASIDEGESVAFLQDLIRLCSVNPPGDEAPVAEAVAGKLKKHGVPVDLDHFAPNRANAVGRLRGNGKPAIVLSGHLDTVASGETPWERDPFSGKLAGGRIWGRGAAD